MRGKETVSEGDQLSPVDITIRAANPLSLPPLQWSHYDSMPEAVYARNTGFTVMIQASFNGEIPYLSSGPLTERYNFSQIHFHWGEHDETGSGHSVDGVRYPLEMHVVHVKKECANLSEASGAKDGIAITVYLFSLREERNTNLDQLTAVLQFIQKPNCCAKLYPSSLSEIVQPFSKDYFLYWGAVAGSSQRHYRIVWLVSRIVLPVSSQQLEQFRQLHDVRGNFILSNSNDPHPLGDRSLFIVSPSEKTNEMFDVSRRPTRSIMTLQSDKSIEIHNAEFKSLVALEDVEKSSCAICPHPNHAGYKTTKNSKHPVRINKGDTSVEESCVDLETKEEIRVEVRKENNKELITTCSHSHITKYIPSQNMFSVISANEEDIHVKRKPLFIRKSDPSVEQACLFLTKPLSVHSSHSTPSLGYLNMKQERTDVSNQPQKNFSSEIEVSKRSLPNERIIKNLKPYEQVLYSTEYKNEVNTNNLTIKRRFKNAATQNSGAVDSFDGNKDPHFFISQVKNPGSADLKQSSDKGGMVNELKSSENAFYRILDDSFKTEYLLVKQAEPKKSFYKVIGEFLFTPDSKRTFVKHDSNRKETLLSEISDKPKPHPSKEELSKKKSVAYNKAVISIPSSFEEAHKNIVVENSSILQSENINANDNRKKSEKNSRYRVNIRVQKPMTDHNNIDAKKDRKEGSSLEYYVTKITPLTKTQKENLELSTEKKLYYAKPIHLQKEKTPGRASQPQENTSNIKYKGSNTAQQIDNDKQNCIYSQYNEDYLKEQNVNLPLPKNVLIDNDFTENKIISSLENNNHSDHLLRRKRVQVIAPYDPLPTETINTQQNKTIANNFLVFTPSSLNNLKTQPQDLKGTHGSEISHSISKTQTIFQDKETNNKNQYFPNLESPSDEHKNLSSNSCNSHQTIKRELPVLIKNQEKPPKPEDFQNLENLTLDKKDPKIKTKPLHSLPTMEKTKHDSLIRDTVNSSESTDIVIKEELEENLVYSSQKSKKKITLQVNKPAYKISSQPPVVNKRSSSHHLVTLKKVEIPDPYCLKRDPRAPLVEYKALPIEYHQPVETIETEEISTEVKTNKTYTSFKKSNKNDVVEQPVPTLVVSKKNKNIKEEYYSNSGGTDLVTRTLDPIYNQLLELEKENLNGNANNDSIKLCCSKSANVNNKDSNKNTQQISVDVYQSKTTLPEENSYSNLDDKIMKENKTTIIIGSHRPKKVLTKENKSSNIVMTEEENDKESTIDTGCQSDNLEMYLSDSQNQPVNIQNIKSSINKTISTVINSQDSKIYSSDHQNKPTYIQNMNSSFNSTISTVINPYDPKICSYDYHNQPANIKNIKSSVKNTIPVITSTSSYDKSMESSGNVTLDQIFESKGKYIDAATSIPSNIALGFTSQHLEPQQLQALNYSDIQEEPTKDPGFTKKEGSPGSHYQNEGRKREVMSTRTKDTEKEDRTTLTQVNPSTNSKSTSTADGEIGRDAIIYIHLPKPDTRSSSKQFRAVETKNVPNPNPKRHMANETSASKKPNILKKSLSAGTYQPSTMSVSDTSHEELVSTHDYEINKEEIRDSTPCNLTFKSEAQVELPSGERAHMRSMAEVKFKSKRSPSIPNKPIKSEAEPSATVATDHGVGGTDTSDCKAVTADCGTVTSNCGIVTTDCKAVTTDCGTVTSNCGIITIDRSTITMVQGIFTMDQETITLEDKCCSAIDFSKGTDNLNNNITVDTTTSVEDNLIVDEDTRISFSPVKIETDKTLSKKYPPLQFVDHWNNEKISVDALLENNGKTVRATLLDDTELPVLRGGLLNSDYMFAELHFHWGRKDCCGAEHIINDQRNSMEAHFLYFKKEYGSVKEGLKHVDGLAMVAIQLNVGGPPHPLFGQLIKDIGLIREAGTGVYVPAPSLFSWIKQTTVKAKGYFSYKGTLSSEPPYVEAVTWFIFQEPIVICCQQSLGFRKLMSPNGELLLKTFRTPQPLNNRPILYVPLQLL